MPTLPPRDDGEQWHARVVEWWTALWRSPMAVEFLESDMHGGLYLLAELHHRWWKVTGLKSRIALAAEIRQQGSRFGLSPLDRRRLGWTVTPDEGAPPTPTRGRREKDHRSVLSLA